jgi:hypothetical protein
MVEKNPFMLSLSKHAPLFNHELKGLIYLRAGHFRAKDTGIL